MYQQDNRFSNQEQFKCKLKCCKACTFCQRAITKERCKSCYCNILSREIKICEKCFFCHSLVLCTTCKKCHKCCSNSSCRDQTSKFLANLARPGCRSKSGSDPKRGLHSSLSDPTKTHEVPHSHKPLCQSSQEQLPVRGITSAYGQKCSGTCSKPGVPRVLQPALFSSKTKQQVETYPGSEQIESFPQGGEIQNGDTGNHQDLPPDGRGVTSIDFKDAYFHIPIQEQSRKYLRFHVQGQTYQFKALPFGLATAPLEFTVVAKEVKLMALHKGIRIHQYLDNWLVRATSHQACLQHTKILVQICQDLGWLVNLEKSELEPKQVFDFVGYQFDLQSGRVRPTPEHWQNLQQKILGLLSVPTCPGFHVFNRFANSHIETSPPRSSPHEANSMAFEKQLASTGIPREGHSNFQVLAPTLTMVVGRKECPHRPTTTPSKTCSANLYRRIKRRVGAHLNEHTARGTWSLPESKLHINYLELKAVFLALKEFQSLCSSNIVLVATDNTTVVSYINKEGGMRSGTLCALLWRILTWCTRNQVTLKARHIPGRLNVVADKLSRLGQTIQTEWSLLPEVFQTICNRWRRPQIELFATRLNNKLPQFVSPVPDPMATAVDSLSLPWEDLDAYAFPPAAILGKVVEKLQDTPCKRIILIAPGWPNMPWFWDLVAMSSQIPLSLPFLPNLLTQPFNQIPHRNLSHLNLHVWLLEPQQSKNRASLRQWQQELRLLKGDQPDQSMKQSGPFLRNGVSLIRWTSGHPL